MSSTLVIFIALLIGVAIGYTIGVYRMRKKMLIAIDYAKNQMIRSLIEARLQRKEKEQETNVE